MKALITPLILTLLAFPSYASELPPCPKDKSKTYDNCFSAVTFSDGASYVGEFKDGKYHGKGTYTFANGKVLSGIFADGKYLYGSVESARSDCAREAGKAATEYAAKQIEKTCLAEKQLEPES